MSYPGVRKPSPKTENRDHFLICRMRLDDFGHVTDVLWKSIDWRSRRDLGPAVVARVGEVVVALHGGARVEALFLPDTQPTPDRIFRIKEHDDGLETVTLADPSAHGLVPRLSMPPRPRRPMPTAVPSPTVSSSRDYFAT